ncbi:hypothetical protein H0H87_003668, partial [Tephrocybe sp. NHM501043]
QFKDLLEFTTLLELYGVLCEWSYDSRDFRQSTTDERLQVISNRKRARQLLEWFFCTYQVLDRDTGIEYDRGRVENTFVANQARALLDYKELAEQTADVHGSITITHKQLKATLRKTLGRKPDGQNFYDDACKTGTFHQFYWPYVIRARDVALP